MTGGALVNPYIYEEAAPPEFDPSTIATHHSLFWASNPAQTRVNNTQYAQWDDMSGNARHASDFGFGSQYHPFYRAAVAGLNNKPALEFDGVDDFYLQGDYATALAQPSGLVVIGAATDRVSGEVQGFCGGNTTAGRQDLFFFSDNLVYINASLSIGGGAASSTGHCWIAEFNTTASKLWQDGTLIAQGNAGHHSLPSLIIGALNGISFPLDGHIALVGTKSGAFTQAERDEYVAGSQSFYGTP